MIIELWALVAASTVLPDIDRSALDRQARAEAARPAPIRAVASKASTPAPRKAIARQTPAAPVGKRFRLDDINEHSAVCRAAGASGDPLGFIEAFGNGYFLSRGETAALAVGCAVYFARALSGRASR